MELVHRSVLVDPLFRSALRTAVDIRIRIGQTPCRQFAKRPKPTRAACIASTGQVAKGQQPKENGVARYRFGYHSSTRPDDPGPLFGSAGSGR